MWTGFYAGLNAGYNFGTNSNAYSTNFGADWTNANAIAAANGITPAIAAGQAVLPGIAALATSLSASNTQSGFIGGGEIGYNYQYGSNVVLGVEADIQGTGIRGTGYGGGAATGAGPGFVSPNFTDVEVPRTLRTTTTGTTTAIGGTLAQGGIDWLGTVRGRLGYLWTPTLLVYGTGGFAYGNAYTNVVQTAYENVTRTSVVTGAALGPFAVSGTNTWLGGGRQNQILTGWTAGGGVEWLFAPNWSLKAEALYWDLGRMNVQTSLYGVSGGPLTTVVPAAGRFRGGSFTGGLNNNFASGHTNISYSGVIARAGVNYHFNWGAAPVVAKY
jgi:outer membrane immunogenic protein